MSLRENLGKNACLMQRYQNKIKSIIPTFNLDFYRELIYYTYVK